MVSGRQAIRWIYEGLIAAGDVLAMSLAIAFRVALVFLFLWFGGALIAAAPWWWGKAVVIGPLAVILAIPVWTFLTAKRTKGDAQSIRLERGRIGPYLLLVAVPIVVVGVLSAVHRALHHEPLFATPLLRETEYALYTVWKQIWP